MVGRHLNEAGPSVRVAPRTPAKPEFLGDVCRPGVRVRCVRLGPPPRLEGAQLLHGAERERLRG